MIAATHSYFGLDTESSSLTLISTLYLLYALKLTFLIVVRVTPINDQ